MDTFLNKNLITTKNAAELSGYTSDYLARLARSGKIVGKKIGHSWLIDTESLARFSEEQGDRKIDYARELARTREAEYFLHQDSRQGVADRSFSNQATNVPIQTRYISQLDVAKSPLRSNIFAFSVAALVLISAALVARAGVIQRLAEGTGSLAFGIASGFSGVSGDISSYIASRAGAMNDEIRAQSANAIAYRSLSSSRTTSSLEEFNFSPARPLSFFENMPTRSFATLAFIPAAPAHTPARGLETLRASASATYAFLTTPSRIARTLADTFVAFGAAIIDTANFAIRADVALAYDLAEAAPRSARATVAFIGGAGDALARITSRVPALATALYLRAIDAPTTLAPGIASAVFDAEYEVAARFVALANTTAARYVALISGTGNLAYEGTAGTLALAHAASSLLSRAPAALEDAYLGALGKMALTWESQTFPTFPRNALAAVLPALSAGEQAALFTYQTVRGLFDSATGALAALFGTSSDVAIVSSPSPTVLPFATSTTAVNAPPPVTPPPSTLSPPTPAPAAPKPTPRIAAVTNYPTYTTVVKGVSEDFVNQSLASLRTNILATVAGMVQPVAAQTVTNATTIQYVNMIQDLSNLIVRNGDFRGGIFDNGIRVSATDGNFTNLTGGSTSGTSGTFSGNLTAATLGVGTTSPSDTFALNGPAYFAQVLAPSVTTNRLYNTGGLLYFNGTALGAGGGGTSSWATTTSQVSGQLVNYSLNNTDIVTIGNTSTTTAPFWFNPNNTTGYISGNLGIGTTSPYAKLSVVGEAVASYFTATSTTATSTFSGGFSIGGSTGFNVYPSGQAVMIGTNTRAGDSFLTIQQSASAASPPVSILSTSGIPHQIVLSNNTTDLTSKKTGILMYHYNSASEESVALISGQALSSSNTVFIGGNDVETGQYNAATELRFLTGATNTTLNGTTRMLIDSSGNVGIGTTSPYAKLSVVGETVSSYFTATSTTATSTFTAGVNVGSGNGYFIGGVGILTKNTSSGSIILGDISGNTRGGGAVALDLQGTRSANDQVASGYEAVAVGNYNRSSGISSSAFGTNNAVTANFSNAFGYGNNVTSSNAGAFGIANTVSASGASAFGNSITNSTASSVMIGPSDAAKLTILSSGNVGIGTTSPYAKLSVVGETVSSYFTATTSTKSTFPYASTTALTVSGSLYTPLTANSIPFISTNGLLAQNTSQFVWDNTNSRLGLGTTSPYAKLSVVGETVSSYFTATSTNATSTFNGAINLASTAANGAGMILSNGTRFIHNYTVSGSKNFFAGNGAGNLTLVSGSIANVGIGTSALAALTSGASNVAVGFQALTANTGSWNTAIGATALSANITGTSNVGVGNNAGASYTTVSNSTFIGANSDALSDGLTNATAIGYNAIVGASNSLILGGTGAYAVNVGIGTTSPYAKLSVVGQVVGSYFTATSTTATSTFGGFIDVNGTGTNATSTIASNLWVKGTLRAAVSYVGDLIFANDFRFTEGDLSAPTQTLHLKNQFGSTTITFVDNGNVGIGTNIPSAKLTVSGNVFATSYEASPAIATGYALGTTTVMAEIPPAVLTAGGNVDLYKLATFTLSGVEALAAKIDAQNMRLTSLEERVVALESGAVSSAGSSPVSFSTSSIASALNSFGVLIQKGIAQFNTLVFRQLVASSDADGTSSAGSVTILAGNIVAQVNNSLVSPSTKVFITFNSPITGSWWVSDKAAGSFRVVVSEPQAVDVSFDYFLVQTEGALATSPPEVIGNREQGTVNSTTTYNLQPTTSGGDTTAPIATTPSTDASIGTDGSQTSTITSNLSPTDSTAPVVTLTGDAAMQITVGDTFADPGATAMDDIDGDLTANIVVTGAVDATTADLYTLTYSATDAADNPGSASRVVTVVASVATATSTSTTI